MMLRMLLNGSFSVNLLHTLERNMSDCASPMASARATNDAARDSDDSASDIDSNRAFNVLLKRSLAVWSGQLNFQTVLHKTQPLSRKQIESLSSLKQKHSHVGIGKQSFGLVYLNTSVTLRKLTI
jgi:hypothetical protein